MPLHAVDAVDDAIGATRSFVGAVTPTGWLKLAVVVLFVGGFGSASFSANLPQALLDAVPAGRTVAALVPGPSPGTVALVVLVGAALSAYEAVRSLLEFVFYGALRDGTVGIGAGLRRWWAHGLQLWSFRVTLAWGLLVGGFAAASTLGPDTSIRGATGPQLGAAVLVAEVLAYAVIAGFTTRFVVPVMIVETTGVLRAWRRFLGVLAAQPGQYAAYLLVGPFVRFVADVLALSAAVLVGVAVAVPLAIVLTPAAVVLAAAPGYAVWPPFLLLSTGLTAAAALVFVVGVLAVRVPFVAFVRLYALAVLAATEPSLSLR